MKTNARFIKSIISAAAEENTVMPWTRGSRRAAFVAKRIAKTPMRRSA